MVPDQHQHLQPLRRIHLQHAGNAITLANQTITNSWSPNSIPSSTNLSENSWAYDISAVAFAWQMTGNQVYLNANPQQALCLCASNFVANYAPITDFIYTQKFIGENESIAYAYDWLYQVMTRRNAKQCSGPGTSLPVADPLPEPAPLRPGHQQLGLRADQFCLSASVHPKILLADSKGAQAMKLTISITA